MSLPKASARSSSSTLASIDFRPLAGEKVFFDTKYLTNYKGIGFVNAEYVISSLRQQMFAAGCLLQEKLEDAEYVVEARVGTLGNDEHEIVYGMPANNGLATAAVVVPNAPPLPSLPEISVARRHNQRAAAKIEDLAADVPTREIAGAAVIGGGTMGSGIAMSFLNAGIPVRLLEVDAGALERGVRRIRDTYDSRLARGRMSSAEHGQRLALLTASLDYGDLASADIVVEAVFEEMEVKEAVFRRLDTVMRQGAILATCAIVKRAVVGKGPNGEDTLSIRPVCFLPLSYDHRLIDGADAARFLQDVKKRIEEGNFESDLGL